MNNAEFPQAPSVTSGVNTRIHGQLFAVRMTKKDLAVALGLSVATASRKLNGHIDWTVTELVRLADVLNTSVAYLVGETPETHRKMKNGLTRLESDRSELVAGAGFEPTTSGL